MVSRWRRALCTSIPEDPDPDPGTCNTNLSSPRPPPLPLLFLNSHLKLKDSPPLPPPSLRLYDDDEPFISPLSTTRFHPIPESHEESLTDAHYEFPPSFHYQIAVTNGPFFSLSPHTSALLLTITAPSGSLRPFVDLVTVLHVGRQMTADKLHALKRAMRALISSLSSNDRLSIVAFSSASKRLLPLRRMTPSARRFARRIVDALHLGQGSCLNDALRKAAKVLHDRKEKNQFATILLMDVQEDQNQDNHSSRFELVSSTRFSHLEIPLHTFRVREELQEDVFLKSLNRFLSVVVLDLRLQLCASSGSAPAEIVAVYSCTDRPALLNSAVAKLGDLYSEEEREILLELKVPAASPASNHILSVRSFYIEPSTKQLICGGDQSLIVPRSQTIRSSDPAIARLRSLFVMTRSVAQSRRLMVEHNDLAGAEKLLLSARAVLRHPNFKIPATDDFRRQLEAELAEVIWRRHEEKRREAATPTSAWKAAERLAKVAIMRKSLNRVSDLHGFEDARF